MSHINTLILMTLVFSTKGSFMAEPDESTNVVKDSGVPSLTAKVGENVSIPVYQYLNKNWHVEFNYSVVLDSLGTNYTNEYAKKITTSEDITSSEGKVQFILTNVAAEDAGVDIRCIDDNNKGTIWSRVLVIAQQSEIQNITSSPVLLASNLTLNCNARSRSLPPNHGLTMSYKWQRNRQLLDEGFSTSNRSLTVVNVTKEQHGEQYRCRAHEHQGFSSPWSEEITLNVQYNPLVIRFHTHPDLITNVENTPVKVSCSADCNPSCDVEVMVKGNITRTKHGKGNVTMSIGTVKRTTVAICKVNNTHGNLTEERKIDVELVSTLNQETADAIPLQINGFTRNWLITVTVTSSVLFLILVLSLAAYCIKKHMWRKTGSFIVEPDESPNAVKHKNDERQHQDRSHRQNRRQAYPLVTGIHLKPKGYWTVAEAQSLIKRIEEATVGPGRQKHYIPRERVHTEARSMIKKAERAVCEPGIQSRYNLDRNNEGLVYVDLDFPPSTTDDAAQPLVLRREPPTHYAHIDFMPSAPSPNIQDDDDYL